MKLEYSHSKTYNFGDDLNPWLWPKLLGDELLSRDDGIHLIGIGTLLTAKRLTLLRDAKELVIFSSGTWDDRAPALPGNCRVYGVRGPRTARRMGLPAEKVIGDGAYLLRTVELPDIIRTDTVGFMPHHRSEQYIDWQPLCDQVGVEFISAVQPVDACLARLRRCRRVITEAMHGAIVADALRIPWTPVKFSPQFREDKWRDFAESMQLTLHFQALPFVYQRPMPLLKMIETGAKKRISRTFGIKPKWQELISGGIRDRSSSTTGLAQALQRVVALDATCLSDDNRVESVTRRQYELVQQLKGDYHAV